MNFSNSCTRRFNFESFLLALSCYASLPCFVQVPTIGNWICRSVYCCWSNANNRFGNIQLEKTFSLVRVSTAGGFLSAWMAAGRMDLFISPPTKWTCCPRRRCSGASSRLQKVSHCRKSKWWYNTDTQGKDGELSEKNSQCVRSN